MIRFPLTERMAQVTRGVSEGKTNKEIANELGIEETTVKNFIRQIMDRITLEPRTRGALAVWHYKEYVAPKEKAS